jgi:uncharacterized tellurite resistance protein B-like protein
MPLRAAESKAQYVAAGVSLHRYMKPNVAKCLLVSKVLVADGMMTENERAFLDRAMKGLGLDEEERKKVVNLDGWDQAEPVVAKLSETERRELLSMLVDAASADGKLSPLELATVKRITAELGLES